MTEIIRNDDGTLIVPVAPERRHDSDDDETVVDAPVEDTGHTVVLHPGAGGYDEALAAWDLQQHPDRDVAVSTASGREQAAAIIDAVAQSPDHAVAPAVADVDDPEASAEALRHVLVGGVHAVEDFATEVADATGHEPLPAHKVTKIIGEVLAEIDT